MANDLFDLFRDQLKVQKDLVATEPHTLETLSEVEEEQEFILEKVSGLEKTEIKVDYSDFANFVFFNSALDYFNITGEKILNEYPFAGTCAETEVFLRSLDAYQRHAVKVWPKRVGHLRIDTSISSSHIVVEDIGEEAGVARGGLLSPNTGSLSVELWFESPDVTGADERRALLQKVTSSAGVSEGYTLYLSGTRVHFLLKSGSTSNEVSAPYSPDEIQYVAAVMDRTSFTGSLSIMTGSQTEFPVVVNTSSLDLFTSLNLGTVDMSIASGNFDGLGFSTTTTVAYSGSLDDVKVWKKARSVNDVSSSFNVKQCAQKNLMALYRFNESGSAFEQEDNKIVIDHSGHNLTGRMADYYDELRGSGSFLIREDPDLILNVGTSDVSEHITEQQTSGSDYDRSNSNKFTDWLPDSFFTLEDDLNTEVLKNFLYVMARHYDVIKTHIDQFINVLRLNYGDFDQTPDALLPVVAKFFGWEFTGNFLNADAFQYLIGRNVLKNVQTNEDLETKLFEIKNQFWKRALLNLVYLYKTKGTRESVEALLRIYGVNENFVRLKEFGYTPDVEIQTQRIHADKGIDALGFGSGTLTGTLVADFDPDLTGSFTVEARFRFPLTSSADITPTVTSGTLFGVDAAVGGESVFLTFEKDALGSHTGSLTLTSSDGSNTVVLSDAGIFDNEWYNIAVTNDRVSGSLTIHVRHIDEDEIDLVLTSSLTDVTDGVLVSEEWTGFAVGGGIGSGFNMPLASQYWAQEVRYWDGVLTSEELDDHVLNFQSYGVSDINEDLSNLKLHWRLREDVTASVGGVITPEDVATDSVVTSVTSSGFNPSENPYKKFLNDYNYIASMDFGWGEDKIRTFDASEIKASDFVNDSKIFGLEFNMIDALNEDIVQVLPSLEILNEAIGFPVNKHRVNYDDLEIIRFNYFKRLQGRLNFRVFADMLDFFDRSFIEMVKRLIPARAHFIGDEFVVESHLLERPKVTYERRKNQETEFVLEGRIEVWSRFGRNKDLSGAKFPFFIGGGS